MSYNHPFILGNSAQTEKRYAPGEINKEEFEEKKQLNPSYPWNNLYPV